MAKRRKRRGVSFGTLVMLLLTCVVCVGCFTILPRLQGNTELHVDATQVFSNLTLDGALPDLSLRDIPITVTTKEPTQAPATDIPTLQPEVQQLLATPTPAPASMTLTLGGNIYVESGVRKSAYFSSADAYDFEEIMSLLAPEMQTDLCIVPLENLIVPDGKVSDLIVPEEALSLLTVAGVDVVPIGFPKAYDQGMKGLSTTLTALRSKGLTPVGAYETAEEAESPTLLTVNNIKVAILHYVDEVSSTGSKKLKSEDAAYALPIAEAETIAADIAQARSAGAQLVIVSLRWGSVGKTAPTKDQTALAQAIADSGADIIAGTGTKAVQPIVWLDGKNADGSAKKVLCAYNLGALLTEDRNKTVYISGVLLQLKLSCSWDSVLTFDQLTYTPTYIWRYKQDSQYQYRVLASDGTPPDAMSSDQQEVMGRALTTVQKALEDSVVTQRTK